MPKSCRRDHKQNQTASACCPCFVINISLTTCCSFFIRTSPSLHRYRECQIYIAVLSLIPETCFTNRVTGENACRGKLFIWNSIRTTWISYLDGTRLDESYSWTLWRPDASMDARMGMFIDIAVCSSHVGEITNRIRLLQHVSHALWSIFH